MSHSRSLMLFLLLLALFVSAGRSQYTYTVSTTNYAGDMSVDHAVDVYVPQGSGPFPAVLLIHGGGWALFDKSLVASDAARLASLGFVCFANNYRLSGTAPWPAQIHDCKAAVRYIRATASTWNVDPNRIAASGYSAGGHLSAMLGSTAGVASLEGSVGTNLSQSSAVDVVCANSAPFDVIALANQAADGPCVSASTIVSWVDALLGFTHPTTTNCGPTATSTDLFVCSTNPLEFLDSSDAPTFMAHSLNDEIVLHSQSRLAYDRYVQAGVECELFTRLYGIADNTHCQYMTNDQIQCHDAFLLRHLVAPAPTSQTQIYLPQSSLPCHAGDQDVVGFTGGPANAPFLYVFSLKSTDVDVGDMGHSFVDLSVGVADTAYLDGSGSFNFVIDVPITQFPTLYFQALVYEPGTSMTGYLLTAVGATILD